jgi:hypothetical protein
MATDAAMSDSMLPCSVCHRHVKHEAAVCPFCGAAFAVATLPTSPPGTRLVAAAAVGAVVGAAMGLGGCSTSHPNMTAFYGAADCVDACGGNPYPGDATTDATEEPTPSLLGDASSEAEPTPDASNDAGEGGSTLADGGTD